ncbi:MAG: phytanoyl-CoA dioxygenase family protein [Planctomycetes bacterium]|nr:phytanoyl-CoA dioxygenase family protein [Planctomycetota bacterium]
MPARLDQRRIDDYRRDGYIIQRQPVLDEHRFAGLRTHFDAMLADLPRDQRPEHLDVPHLLDTRLFDWLFDDAVLDLVEPLIGPDIALFSSHFLCKPPGDGKRVPWHEDGAYWRGMLAPMEVVTVWLAIDESDVANGCMRVIPGSHRRGDSDYAPVPDPAQSVFDREVVAHQVDAKRAVDLELSPNQASLHDAGLMHGSNFNRSHRRRCGYTMRYMSTRVRFANDSYPHQIYLARGRDHAGNRYGDPARTYPDLVQARDGVIRKGH